MADTLHTGDKSQRFAPCGMARSDMRSLGSVVRPLMKTRIVNRAIAGRITPQEAERLIAAYKLENA